MQIAYIELSSFLKLDLAEVLFSSIIFVSLQNMFIYIFKKGYEDLRELTSGEMNTNPSAVPFIHFTAAVLGCCCDSAAGGRVIFILVGIFDQE